MRKLLFFLSLLFIIFFTAFSYTVARERFSQFDFDITVKLQDRIPKNFDDNFSIFSLLGSVEVTFGLSFIMVLISLVRMRLLAVLGWLMIIPATAAEVFGKLVLFHPGPPVLFQRTNLFTHLPSFYVHTEFSYPSGHMTRTAFIITVLICMAFFSKVNLAFRLALVSVFSGLGFLMALTRISLGEHWLSDVIGGGLLGIGAGLFAYALIFKKHQANVANSKISL